MISAREIKEKYYINSKVFRHQLEDYYESDSMTNELAENIVKIAEGLSYNFRFINYTRTWKEEMVGDATIKMYQALEKKSFRLSSDFNPFSYFNRIAWNAFTNRINKEKTQHECLNDYKDVVYSETMGGSQGNVYVKPITENDDGDFYDD
jgi:DNA-directed RNA polymerase specialized sigma24 family protein